MNKILWLDVSAGAAGDMICGALLDCGGSWDSLHSALSALEIKDFSIQREEVMRGAFRACHFQVDSTEDHHHRTWASIRSLLETAELPNPARAQAIAIFNRIAEAEGKLHGQPPDQVHFHEVGAIDSIVDIVGACILLHDLQISEIVATAVPLGSGSIDTAHGVLPLPAPAVLNLLEGWPTVQDNRTGELVTPTGAGIITTLAKPGAMPSMIPKATGHGAGTRNPADRANIVRAVIGEPIDQTGPGESVEVLAATVDDMSPEHVPPLLDVLLDAGALDAWAQPAWMKKGRPGLVITVLAPQDHADALAEVLLLHSSTFGLRRSMVVRNVLEREFQSVATPYGDVRVKIGFHHGEAIQASPEFEDCVALAKSAGVPVSEVHAAAVAAYRSNN